MLVAASVLAATLPGTLVVLNKSEATASLIDVATKRVVATARTGEAPHEAALSPDGRRVLLTNYGTAANPGSTLTVLGVPDGNVLRTIDLGGHKRPHGVQWLDEGWAVVTSEASRALLLVDVGKGAVEAALPTEQEISHMVVVTRAGAPGGRRAFVANIGSGTVTVFDLDARKRLAQVATGAGSEGLDLTPDGRELWVCNRAADAVSVVDTATLKVVATLPSKSFPIRVKVTPDGRRALVSNARSGDVAVFDVARRREIARISMRSLAPDAAGEGRMSAGLAGGSGPAPVGILVAPDGKTAWVANTNADAIAVLDLGTWSVAGTLRAGKEPDGMALSPVTAPPSAR